MKVSSFEKSFFKAILKFLPTIIVFVLLFVIVIIGLGDINKASDSESLTIAENSIRRAVITCYAQEGSYPESLEYLKENYGLKVSDSYIVYYSIFAPNIMPDIRVVRKQVTN